MEAVKRGKRGGGGRKVRREEEEVSPCSRRRRRRRRQMTGGVWGCCFNERTNTQKHKHSDTAQLEPAAAVYPATSGTAASPRQRGNARRGAEESDDPKVNEESPGREKESVWETLRQRHFL